MTNTRISRAHRGADGKLRPIIRALIYAALAFWLLSADEFLGPPLRRAATALHATGLSPSGEAFYETINLITALLLTWIFGLYEGRRVDDYGLPIRQAFGARFWEGFAVGVVHATVVAAGMMVFGGMKVQGLALHGTAILWATLAWLGSNVLVGIAEEYLFRGYLLQTLWKSLGFWPAAVLIALWLRTSFQGPAWVTGGALGSEASFFMYPTIALTFLYVSWRRFSNQPPP